MINISKISKKFSQVLFLGIFISFLTISISHSHHFSFHNTSQFTSESSSDHLADLFLDSELNCAIHFLNNSLFGYSESLELSNDLFPQDQHFTLKVFNKSLTKQFFQFSLRGPPIQII